MKRLLILLTLAAMTNLKAQKLNLTKLTTYEIALDDVMEIIDLSLIHI